MRNRRVSDQVVILQAIADVRVELSLAKTQKDGIEILGRLISLYALLDTGRLVEIAKAADTRIDIRRIA